jgi:hypothetical protein
VRFTLNRGAVQGYRLVIGFNRDGHITLTLCEREYQELLKEVKRLDGEETPRQLDELDKLAKP